MLMTAAVPQLLIYPGKYHFVSAPGETIQIQIHCGNGADDRHWFVSQTNVILSSSMKVAQCGLWLASQQTCKQCLMMFGITLLDFLTSRFAYFEMPWRSGQGPVLKGPLGFLVIGEGNLLTQVFGDNLFICCGR